ncbi:uncharacterized protein N7529_008595 [Penicillium soppii]|uniref:uncharacterized protein n=1 Tax=Penicillium soppii TaxID=69789 RepID=UPI002548C69C|nr:uncharacterized protein N7529_008595 [Penicillium soppii]KAJ5861285.1 hypothetical protein N7529_008595 [Penicillium soppii]
MCCAKTNESLEVNADVEDYTNRPPYLLQPLQRFGETKWRAHCQCGQVKYALRRARTLNAKFCHCRQCQVLHGAPFQWAAIFPKEDIRFENGPEGLSFYAAGEKNHKYQTPTKVSCSICRTPIMDEGRNMCLLFPQLIDLSGSPDEQRHRMQHFCQHIHDGIAKWSGMDEQSQQLDDDGQPLKP